jgi:hypothetical protein
MSVSHGVLKARRAHFRVVQENRWLIGVIAAVLVPGGIGLLVLRPGTQTGLLVGAGWSSAVWGTALLVERAAGTGPKLMGETAEQWTAIELRKLERAGWRVVPRLLLDGQDVDHVALSPVGVFVLETKWSAAEWTVSHRTLPWAARQARNNARSVGLLLMGQQRGVEVRPVIVIWGDHHDVGEFDGVPIVPGGEIRDWLLRQEPVAVSDFEAAADALERQAEVRRDYEDVRHPTTRYEQVGVYGVASDFLRALSAVLVTLLAGAYLLIWLHPLLAVAVLAATGVGGALAWRRPQLALVGLAVMVTSIGLTTVVGAALLLDRR